MHGLKLLGIYVIVAFVAQAIGFGVSSFVEQAVPWAGLPVFLTIFFGAGVLAWPAAVFLLDRFFPEPAEVLVRSRAV